jgi:hypothetical protein
MYVAKSRQKPAENAFEKRARLKTEAAEAKAAATAPAPVAPVEPKPDAEALAKSSVPFDRNPASEEYTQAPDIATVEPAKGKRGRKPDPAVQERNARVLEAVVKAGPVGISKPDIAAQLNGEKEQQIYTSLQKLRDEGKVKSEYLDGLGYRWLAL